MSAPHIFLSAGETSGDHYGAAIQEALRARLPGVSFSGLGGLAMERAGQRRIVRAEDVAVMGITEILRHVPHIYRSYRRLVRAIRRDRPAAAVLIDFPDVNFRLARHLRRAGVPVLWFVSPQLWAWKRGRLRWVQERVDRMLVIFPFEERFYRARGVAATFVGHPFAGLPAKRLTRQQYAEAHMFAASEAKQPSSHLSRTWIALLPGSRWKEVTANLPTMLEAAAALGPGFDFLIPVAATLATADVGRVLCAEIERIGWPAESSVTLVPDAAEALGQARVAAVASGTATVLAAAVGTPFVVVYRVSPLTYGIARRLVRYPAEIPATRNEAGDLPVGMVNLIAGRRIVPELLNQRFTAEALAAELRRLLLDGPERATQMAGLEGVRAALQAPGPGGEGAGPIETVADALVDLLHATPAAVPPRPAAGDGV